MGRKKKVKVKEDSSSVEDDGLTLEEIDALEYDSELGETSRHLDRDRDHHDNSLDIIFRDDWCDEAPVSVLPVTTIPTLVRVMHTYSRKKVRTQAETEDLLREIHHTQTESFNQGYRDIRYNFAIGVEGEIYECRGWNVKPEVLPHPIDNTEERVDIAYIGDFSRKMPPYLMMKSAISLIQYGIKHLYLHPACKVKHLDLALKFKTQKSYRNIMELVAQ